MDYATAVAAVVADTRRPTLESIIRRKITGAIKVIQSLAHFPQDLLEEVYSGAALTADSYIQSLTLPARTRAVAYVQDPDRALEDGTVIEIVDYTYVLNNPRKTDLAYRAGSVLQVKLEEVPTSLKLGVYTYLPQLLDTETNWVLTEFGEQVVDYAVAWVFRYIGETEAANALERTALTSMQLAVADFMNQPLGMA